MLKYFDSFKLAMYVLAFSILLILKWTFFPTMSWLWVCSPFLLWPFFIVLTMVIGLFNFVLAFVLDMFSEYVHSYFIQCSLTIIVFALFVSVFVIIFKAFF